MKNKDMFEAIATLVGTIIGAGILGMPYVIAEAGFWTGLIDIVLFGFVVLMLYLYLGEVTLRTKGLHQLPGYAEKYLGKIGKRFMVFAMVFGNYGALIAYIIGVGSAVAAISGGSPLIYSIIFSAVMGFIIYIGVRAVGKSELLLLPLIMGIVIFVASASFEHIDLSNLAVLDLSSILVPYGVILFAFLGASAIPVLREMLIDNEKKMKKAIITGVMIPLVSYLIFAAAVVGVTGVFTTEVATIGLGQEIGRYMILVGNFLAVVTMTTSFLTLGLALKETYDYDYNIDKNIAWALTMIVPFIVAVSGFTTFVAIIGLSGVIAGGIEGIIIAIMAVKAKKYGNRKPEYSIPINWAVASIFIILFAGGAGFYLWNLL